MFIKLVINIIFILLVHITNAQKVEILMPNVTTNKEDAYMCKSYKIEDNQSFITSIEPMTNMNIAHHMFAYGCERPAVNTDRAWMCGEVCNGEKSILFAWGRNAPSLNLPQDVAFKIGSSTKIRYIVINIHYLDKVNNDKSGLSINFSDKPRKYQAGISLMVSGHIDIPPFTKKYHSDLSCKYDGPDINVFAFRVHAHTHGDVNTAYRVRNHKWDLIAQGDPQWPQAFYPTEQIWSLTNDDILIGRCKYHNDEDRHIYAGPTHNDEMCNIYLMYYYDSNEKTIEFTCGGSSYPQLENIIPDSADIRPSFPNKDASSNDNYHSHHNMQSGSESSNPVDGSNQIIGMKKYPFRNQFEKQQLIKTFNRESYDDLIGNNLLDELLYDTQSEELDTSQLNFDPYPLRSDSSKLIYKPQFKVKKYTQIDSWYNKNKISFGQVGGIALNGDLIYIFHRGSQIWQQDSFNHEFKFNIRKYPLIKEDTILIVNCLTGELVKSFGSETFLMPHGINIDSNGNIWVTDVGLHQIIKYSNDKFDKPSAIFGEKTIPGKDHFHFCQPSDIAILSNGDFFVADGYCNSRILKFDSKGNYITEWASEEHGKPGHFFVPHALALHESNNLICVADRENRRVQCFDLLGNFMFQSSNDNEFGPIYGVAFAKQNSSILFALNGFNIAQDKQHERKVFLIETKHGNVIDQIYLDQNLIKTPHNIKVSSDSNDIYISHLNPPERSLLFKVVKNNFTKNPVQLDTIDPDKENFRTSMFIMAFLALPVCLAIIVATIVRLKNMNKLNWFKDRKIESWLSKEKFKKKTYSNKVVGFTRLNQDSDNEIDPLEVTDSESDEIETMNRLQLSSA